MALLVVHLSDISLCVSPCFIWMQTVCSLCFILIYSLGNERFGLLWWNELLFSCKLQQLIFFWFVISEGSVSSVNQIYISAQWIAILFFLFLMKKKFINTKWKKSFIFQDKNDFEQSTLPALVPVLSSAAGETLLLLVKHAELIINKVVESLYQFLYFDDWKISVSSDYVYSLLIFPFIILRLVKNI